MFKIIKKADIVLFLVLIIISIGLSAAGFVLGSSPTDQKQVVISVAGSDYGTYDLNQDQEIDIERGEHFNKVIIKNGTAQISEANCHNQLCVHQGSIQKVNQRIICLPNRVMVEIIGVPEGGEPDVVTG